MEERGVARRTRWETEDTEVLGLIRGWVPCRFASMVRALMIVKQKEKRGKGSHGGHGGTVVGRILRHAGQT
jgi:hypothetical protein